ncbi:MAG: hypothetical protein DELT_02530 [Desulfovibrio sp.]
MPDKEHVLYLPNGDEHRFDVEALTSEIATRQNAGASLSDLGLWLSQLPDPDPVLRKRGEDAAVLAELSADDQVTTAMLSRKNRVLNSPHFGFRPGAPDGETASPEAQLVYDRFAQDLERSNLRSIISGILDAPFYGMTPLELLWEFGDGWWHLKDIVPRPYHWFAYNNENKPIFRGEQGFACVDPLPLPPAKFVIATHHGTYDNPYGLRLLSRCLWPVAFKRGGLQFYAKFVERHGMPWVVGNAPAKATAEEKRKMAVDLARMVRDCVAALSAGSDVKLIAPTGGQDMTHERFISRQDKAISKLLMGQTLTVEMEGRNNSQAAATTHEQVAEGLADSDKAMVVDAFNEIAWAYTQLNAGPGVFSPLASYEEPEDLVARAELDKKLYEMGVEFTAEHFADNYNLKATEFKMRAPVQSGYPFMFAAPKGTETKAPASPAALPLEAQKRLDAAISELLPEAVKASDAFVTQIENAVKSATSFDQLQLELAKLLAPRATPSELEKLLSATMTAAAGFGAAAVQAEVKEDE